MTSDSALENLNIDANPSIDVATPRVIESPAELISVSKSSLVVKLGNRVLFLERKGKRVEFSVWIDNGGRVVPEVAGTVGSTADIENLDVDDELKNVLRFFVSSWDLILKQRVAEIILRSNVKVVPKQIRDEEILAERLAEKILERATVKTFYVKTTSKDVELGMFCFNSEHGVYEECEQQLKRIAEEMLNFPELRQKTTTKVIAEAIEKVRRRTWTEYKPEKGKLVFYNKVFNWRKFVGKGILEEVLEDPSPDLVVMHWIPHRINVKKLKDAEKLKAYIPPRSVDDVIEVFEALAPKFYQAFLAWVKRLDEAEDQAKPRVVLLLEVIGYTLYPHEYPFHKAVLLVGEGSNGKSTFLRLIRTILGEHNVASINLRDLDPRVNRFAAAELFGKLANISTEPVRGLVDPTLFKQLTGEDLVTAERKFKDPFQFVNYAKMIFAANELPRVLEDTYAFWRRWIVVEFPNRFPQNPHFFEETFTEEEIEGIIISALYAFRLALLRGGFAETSIDVKDEWMKRSDEVYRVAKAMMDDGLIELDKNDWVVKKDLYMLYTAYCRLLSEEEGEDVSPVPQRVLTEKLEQLFGVRSGQKKVGGKKYSVYIGIKIKDRKKAEDLVGHLETPEGLTHGGA